MIDYRKNPFDSDYLMLVKEILERGEQSNDRTGVGTLSIFHAPTLEFDLTKGFPLLTSKHVWFHGACHEILWQISGSTNAYDLPEEVQKIWDKKSWHIDNQGNLGRSYGHQFRNAGKSMLYDGYDQLKETIENIKENPQSRRHVISLWQQPDVMHDTNLPPCHGIVIQFYVRDNQYLDCRMYQRSADVMVGVPFNIAEYALLTHMVAQVTGYWPGTFMHTIGDAHIYKNHVDGAKKQLGRTIHKPPRLDYDTTIEDIDDFEREHFAVIGYEHESKIDFPLNE